MDCSHAQHSDLVAYVNYVSEHIRNKEPRDDR